MENIIRSLYYIVDDWAGQQYENNEEAQILLARQSELKEEIALRLGEGGQTLLDTLSDLNLSLEDIHDEALFRAAMQLGTEIAGYGRGRTAALSPSQLNATGRWSPVGTAQRRPSRRRDR